MEILGKVRTLISNPDKFYDSVKGEDIGQTITYLLVILLVPAALITIFSSFILGLVGLILGSLFGALSGVGTIFSIPAVLSMFGFFIGAMFYVSGFLGSFISAAIYHVVFLVMGTKNGFSSTYKAVVYGGTPSFLLSWVPGLNVIFGAWSWYLTVKGISKLQNMTMRRAFFATIVPTIFVIIIAGISLNIAFLARSLF
jgi:hypothetical protein